MVTQFQSRPGSTQPLPTNHESVLIQFPPGEKIEVHALVAETSAPRQSATPREISLGNLSHPSLRLRSPLRLDVSRDGDSVGVWSPELEEMGYGPNLGAAIEDFQQTLIELFLTLEADAKENRLGAGMEQLWERLQHVIAQRA